MYKEKKITVLIPAHNEEKLIVKTLNSIPEFIDNIIVIEDASSDLTYKQIIEVQDERIHIIKHKKNKGVGGAIISGYKHFLKTDSDIAVVMAGDNQMDPLDLPAMLDPICSGKCNYTKGNRLYYKDAFKKMPKTRFLGNALLTLLTKIASGYWNLVDFQCGYTSIDKCILRKINLDKIYPRYGFPNDILIKLNCVNAKVVDTSVNPIYGDEKSGIRVWKFIPIVSFILLKGFFYRLWRKNILYDFHPFVFLYLFGLFLTIMGSVMGVWILVLKYCQDTIATIATIVLCAIFLIVGVQSLLFAMMFDMLSNKHLTPANE
jgi:glycosyltransferase involved in cell wall biosynthesis